MLHLLFFFSAPIAICLSPQMFPLSFILSVSLIFQPVPAFHPLANPPPPVPSPLPAELSLLVHLWERPNDAETQHLSAGAPRGSRRSGMKKKQTLLPLMCSTCPRACVGVKWQKKKSKDFFFKKGPLCHSEGNEQRYRSSNVTL